jgi:hypothetical protein
MEHLQIFRSKLPNTFKADIFHKKNLYQASRCHIATSTAFIGCIWTAGIETKF